MRDDFLVGKICAESVAEFLRGTFMATVFAFAPGRIEGNYEMRSSPISLPPGPPPVPEEGNFREAKHNKMVYLQKNRSLVPIFVFDSDRVPFPNQEFGANGHFLHSPRDKKPEKINPKRAFTFWLFLR